MTLDCPHDDCAGQIEVDRQPIGSTFTCPACSKESVLQYDEAYNPEDGEEYGWFWLEAKPR